MNFNIISKEARLERRGLRIYCGFQILKYMVFPRLEEKEESMYVEGWRKEIRTRIKLTFYKGIIVL